MRRDRPIRGNQILTVLFPQLPARIGMERQVQRLQLLPQPVFFFGNIIRRHVVIRTPQRSHVGVPQLARSRVSQLHHPRIPLPHRRANGMPSQPGAFQFLRVAAFCHQFLHRRNVQALSFFPLRTPLSFSIIAREAFTPRLNNSVSAFSMYFFASSAVGRALLLSLLAGGVCPRLAICATSNETTGPQRIATRLRFMPPPFSSSSPLPSIPSMPARNLPGPRPNASPRAPNRVPCPAPKRRAHAPRRTIPPPSSPPGHSQKSRCSTAPSRDRSSTPEFAQSL